MTQSQIFSSGFGLAPFVTSSGLLLRPWKVITSRYGGIVSHQGNGISWKSYEDQDLNLTIIAFEVNPDIKLEDVKQDFHSSSGLEDFRHLCTQKNPTFQVNSFAVSLFNDNRKELEDLKSKIISSSRLIVTGHALGGSFASLFTLWLLNSIDSKKKRPLCITFGSPLIADKNLQETMSRSSAWNSCFLHVVSYKDPLPKALKPHTSAYMPFGTFLFCSDENSTCFENPESVLKLLSIQDQNQVSQSTDYGNIIQSLQRRAIFKDITARAEDLNQSNSLHACISLQLWALGLTPHVQHPQQQNTLVEEMEKLEDKFIKQKNKFDPTKKLNILKIDMAKLEWYKKDSKTRNIGYYDSYKKMELICDQHAVEFQKRLTNYWKDMVEEAGMKPQKEGAAFRTRWLHAGNNYRRMVEPLEIAQHYKEGRKDYVKARPRHYAVLEDWLKEGRKEPSDSNITNKKNVELILTNDSCFWAHVEEALLSCKKLENVQSSVTEKQEANIKLVEFEGYVYEQLKKYEVSPEIFLKDSSYMTWWNKYKALKETTHAALASFMNMPNHYIQYTEGHYDFP